ncbi:uncharacterized protein BDR25DRAFT_363909 [Lindgomyces ingoldianus]|uniref:Uncharacterized protein n=1 Tax=Lindgomyces ingoldianus TaxID=673940 RepID=A0ACB6Q7P2_9PLEO|nr:uncharacterized protein BDR25DRAFT_363909 [Lindgomyces ingoldianus]KAF2462550.1 hypothetical protein BDR25DRAFT_363909 [Lindgomyces ingoldianus]
MAAKSLGGLFIYVLRTSSPGGFSSFGKEPCMIRGRWFSRSLPNALGVIGQPFLKSASSGRGRVQPRCATEALARISSSFN